MAPPPAIVTDSRFHAPLQLRTLFDLTFHTHRYYEGQNGSFGFQYLLIIPLVVAGVWAARSWAAVSAAVIAMVSCVLVLRAQPNARYLYASLPWLWVAAFAAVLAWTRDHNPRLYRGAIALVACIAALGVWFLPSSSWSHKGFYLDRPFEWMRAQRAVGEVAPFREMARYAASRFPASAILLARENDIADLAGDAHEHEWHELPLEMAIFKATNQSAMLRLMRQYQIRYIIDRQAVGKRVQPPSLWQVVTYCTTKVHSFGSYSLLRLDPACPDPPPQPALETCPAGTYDDFDPRVLFRGDWVQDDDSSAGAVSGMLDLHATAERGGRFCFRRPRVDLCLHQSLEPRHRRGCHRWRHAWVCRSILDPDRMAEPRCLLLLHARPPRAGNTRDRPPQPRRDCKLHRRGCADRQAVDRARCSEAGRHAASVRSAIAIPVAACAGRRFRAAGTSRCRYCPFRASCSAWKPIGRTAGCPGTARGRRNSGG